MFVCSFTHLPRPQNRFSSAPEIYKQFLEILQTYQRESKPIQDVYAQVTQLFNTAPDLLEDFKQFLPESAAHAKQQAAARMAEEAVPTSNLRGEPVGHPSSTPSRDVKMPPLGQFNVKDSGKESKKRRGGPGVGLSSVSGPSGADAARMPEARGGPPTGSFTNGNKVCLSHGHLLPSWLKGVVRWDVAAATVPHFHVRSTLPNVSLTV